MAQIQEVWNQIQAMTPATNAPGAAATSAAAQPIRIGTQSGEMQPQNAPGHAGGAAATGALTPTARPNGLAGQLHPEGVLRPAPQTTQAPAPPPDTFIERGRFEEETLAAQQLDTSLQGMFEPTAHLDAAGAMAASMTLPGLELTSVALAKSDSSSAVGAGQNALCIDCGVPYDRGQCPACGHVAR